MSLRTLARGVSSLLAPRLDPRLAPRLTRGAGSVRSRFRRLFGRASSRLRSLLRRSPRLFVALCSPDDRELGELGEEVAARHLARRGLSILARRLRTRAGEVDLVARSGQRLVVVEVKTGRSKSIPRPRGVALPPDALLRWRPGVRCDARKLARLRAIGRELGADPSFRCPGQGARISPLRAPACRTQARVDLVEVFLCERKRRFRVLHHPDLRAPLP